MCGSLLPNDLELFDMLGNESEWVQDGPRLGRRRGVFIEIVNAVEHIIENNPRTLRGGAFDRLPALARAASHDSSSPSNRDTNFDFRPARTCP